MGANVNLPTTETSTPDRRRGGRWAVPLAAACCAVATPVATWWLVGDQTAKVAPGTPLDYMVRPPQIAPLAERSAGVLAVLVAGAAAVYLVRASRRGRFDRRWWGALGPVLGVGAIAGCAVRVITMGSIGANIGAGLVMLLGGPLAALLLLWAAIWSARLLLSRRGAARTRE